jgi:YbbR domain-containing protein
MIMQQRIKKHSLKLISVLISFVIWIYVLNSEKMQIEKIVSVDYILPEDRVFSITPPQEVTFKIKGIRAFARSVIEKKDRIVLDLNHFEPDARGEMKVKLDPQLLKLPYGMKTESVLPQDLIIKLERKVRKILPLKLQFMGELPENFVLQEATLNPKEVEVSGPHSVLSSLEELNIAPVDISTLPGRKVTEVLPIFPDERISLSEKSPVRLNYQIKASVSNFILENQPIRFISNQQNIKFDVKTVKVSLFLSDKIMKNRLNISSSVEVWAEIPQKVRGRVLVPLKVIVPPSMHLLEISPKSIIVNVE